MENITGLPMETNALLVNDELEIFASSEEMSQRERESFQMLQAQLVQLGLGQMDTASEG
jgi:hypothetical protein